MKLKVATRHENSPANVLNYDDLANEPNVLLCFQSLSPSCLRVECIHEVREASRETILPDKEVPNVAK